METERITILIVDDIEINVEILENIIQHAGYETMGALSVKEAIGLIKETKPTLILSDLSMPEVDGLEFCRMLKSDPATRDIPFIVISVLDTSEEKEQAFKDGAVDFIPKPFDAVEVIMRVNNHLNSYRLKREMADYNRRMHTMVDKQKKQFGLVQKNILQTLVNIMAKKDSVMGNHLDKVGYNCRQLAQGLQFIAEYESEITDEFVENIETAAKLHMAGSLVMQENAFLACGERGNLKEEYVRRFTEEGVDILEKICNGLNEDVFLSMTIRIAKYQYASWDGTGYPAVSGKDIPLEARILALVDDFDDLITVENRNVTCSLQEAFEKINEKSGTVYEPEIVEVFNKIRHRFKI